MFSTNFHPYLERTHARTQPGLHWSLAGGEGTSSPYTLHILPLDPNLICAAYCVVWEETKRVAETADLVRRACAASAQSTVSKTAGVWWRLRPGA